MNYLDKLVKNIEFNGKKSKNSNLKTFGVLAILGVAIGGAVTVLFAHGCCEKTKNIVIKNVENIVENVEEIDDDVNINRDEIKQTLEKVGEESLGEVGIAMENALEDLEDEKEKDNEAK